MLDRDGNITTTELKASIYCNSDQRKTYLQDGLTVRPFEISTPG